MFTARGQTNDQRSQAALHISSRASYHVFSHNLQALVAAFALGSQRTVIKGRNKRHATNLRHHPI